jgi:hypothetical protein
MKESSLYADWQARRKRCQATPTDQRADIELRVLDFLLRAYRDSPLAAQPPRFPLSDALRLNTRLVVVMHHLGSEIAAVKSEADAQERVVSIVRRLAEPRPEAPDPVGRSPRDPVDEVRMLLGSEHARERLVALRRLCALGTLDDIGLLADLLSLPEQPDDHPQEREAIGFTMDCISHQGQSWSTTPAAQGEFVERRAAEFLAARAIEAIVQTDERGAWQCPNCGAPVPPNHDECWSCDKSVYEFIRFPIDLSELPPPPDSDRSQ